jgi:all-trans-8'-apo-beta-carotenal 15,15'-oxygenase
MFATPQNMTLYNNKQVSFVINHSNVLQSFEEKRRTRLSKHYKAKYRTCGYYHQNTCSPILCCVAKDSNPVCALPTTWDLSAWLKGWDSVREEVSVHISETERTTTNDQSDVYSKGSSITGKIPKDLRGTLYRNGPAKFEVGKVLVKHPWDGDGMITAISISDNGVWFRNRFVRTKGYLAEQAAGRVLYRGTFGTQKPGGWIANAFDLSMKNVANTGVVHWDNKLFAFWEAGVPYQLNPSNLSTFGPTQFQGAIPRGGNFTAHPKVDPCTGSLIGFSTKAFPRGGTEITFHEMKPGFQWRKSVKTMIPGFGFYHDFGVTENYYVLFQGPLQFDPLPFILGVRPVADCIHSCLEKPAKIILISRNSVTEEGYASHVHLLSTETGFVFHFANAYEEEMGDGERALIVDLVKVRRYYAAELKTDRSQDPCLYENLEERVPKSCLYRYVISIGKGNPFILDQLALSSRQVEFPGIHPSFISKHHSFLYASTSGLLDGVAPFQGIVKVDVHNHHKEQVWIPKSHEFAGEPLFVPSPTWKEDDQGYLLTVVYDGSRHLSYLAILDAQHISDGPICRVDFPIHIPHGLHGCWTDTVYNKEQIQCDLNMNLTIQIGLQRTSHAIDLST